MEIKVLWILAKSSNLNETFNESLRFQVNISDAVCTYYDNSQQKIKRFYHIRKSDTVLPIYEPI